MKKRRSGSLGELAVCYFAHSTAKSALSQLGVWIRRDPSLWKALEEAGFRKGQHNLTPRQVQLIYDHLGEPDD